MNRNLLGHSWKYFFYRYLDAVGGQNEFVKRTLSLIH